MVVRGSTRSSECEEGEKRQRDRNMCEETVGGYKAANKSAKRAAAKAKAEAYKICMIVWIAKQKNRESQGVYQAKYMKDTSGVVLVEDDDIRERWRTYFKQLMNVEDDRIKRVIATRGESEVENITTEEDKEF